MPAKSSLDRRGDAAKSLDIGHAAGDCEIVALTTTASRQKVQSLAGDLLRGVPDLKWPGSLDSRFVREVRLIAE
jgi:hypothetical protein